MLLCDSFHVDSMLVTRRRSLWAAAMSWSMTSAGIWRPSRNAMESMRERIAWTVGFENVMLNVVEYSGCILGLRRSLQMQIMGTCVLRISALIVPMPPRSPPDIPSTSSSTIARRPSFAVPGLAQSPMERLWMVWLSSLSSSFLLRVSLAFSSSTSYPSSWHTRCTAVVLPMPGAPDMSIARNVFVAFGPGFLKWACSDFGQSRSHACSFSTLALLPTSSLSCFGAYLDVHNWPGALDVSSARAAAWTFFSSAASLSLTRSSSFWAPRSAISCRNPSSSSVLSRFFWMVSSFLAPAPSPTTTKDVLDEGAVVTLLLLGW